MSSPSYTRSLEILIVYSDTVNSDNIEAQYKKRHLKTISVIVRCTIRSTIILPYRI